LSNLVDAIETTLWLITGAILLLYPQVPAVTLETSNIQSNICDSMSDLSSYPAESVTRAKSWPKVELHLHLDGSLSPDFISSRAAARGISLPAPPAQLRAWLMDRKLDKLRKDDNAVDQGKNWPVFDFCNQFLQTASELEEATLDLLNRLAEQKVVYAEIRFCPHLHMEEGLTVDQVVEAVIAGVRGQDRVVAGIILAALRSKGSSHGLEIAALSAKYLQKTASDPYGVVGMDVAGDEGNYPLSNANASMAAGVEEAKRLGVPLTLHAGEWPERFGSVANLEWAVNSGARRVGHGIAARSDEVIVKALAEKGVTVEVCLTSNIGNGFKVANYGVHPVKILSAGGVAFSLSSDNLLLSGDHLHAPSPTMELLHLVEDVGLGWEAARKSVLDGLGAAFSPSVTTEFVEEVAQDLKI